MQRFFSLSSFTATNVNKAYTNGAMVDPSVSTINALNNIKKILIGASYHFLSFFIKSQYSDNIKNLLILFPTC